MVKRVCRQYNSIQFNTTLFVQAIQYVHYDTNLRTQTLQFNVILLKLRIHCIAMERAYADSTIEFQTIYYDAV